MSRPLVIGQNLNAAGSRRVAWALARRDAATIADVARRQVAAGAGRLDICAAGTDDEPGALQWLAQTVQEAADVPLSLDTHNLGALRRALPLCRRPPLINSVSVTQSDALWVLLRDWSHCPVVALCLGERGAGATAEERLESAARLSERLDDCGVPAERILFDPLTLPAINGRAAQDTTFQTMTALRERFPTSRVLCAVGNFGYGLPAPMRRAAEWGYARAALGAGADAFLCDSVSLDPLSLRLLGRSAPDVVGEDVGDGGEGE